MAEEIAKGNIRFGKFGKNVPRIKKFLSDDDPDNGLTPETIWYADEVGTNDSARKALIAIFGKKDVFESPKPVGLLERVLQIACGPNDIILDSFCGSATTGHAVLAANAADGGSRRCILVELEAHIAKEVASRRLNAAIKGYDAGGKNGEVDGLGGGFRYCTLGTPLFDEQGNISDEVAFEDLAAHVYFAETGQPLPPPPIEGRTPFLGTHKGVAVYLLFNGILGDKSVAGGNVLTGTILSNLPTHNGPKVIFGEGTRLGPERRRREGIVFKQIPYDIKVG